VLLSSRRRVGRRDASPAYRERRRAAAPPRTSPTARHGGSARGRHPESRAPRRLASVCPSPAQSRGRRAQRRSTERPEPPGVHTSISEFHRVELRGEDGEDAELTEASTVASFPARWATPFVMVRRAGLPPPRSSCRLRTDVPSPVAALRGGSSNDSLAWTSAPSRRGGAAAYRAGTRRRPPAVRAPPTDWSSLAGRSAHPAVANSCPPCRRPPAVRVPSWRPPSPPPNPRQIRVPPSPAVRVPSGCRQGAVRVASGRRQDRADIPRGNIVPIGVFASPAVRVPSGCRQGPPHRSAPARLEFSDFSVFPMCASGGAVRVPSGRRHTAAEA
jgi:hypothetical protein